MKPICAGAMRKTLPVSATAMVGVLAAILSEVKIALAFGIALLPTSERFGSSVHQIRTFAGPVGKIGQLKIRRRI
jgi:energy-converting hydrogenase Eha subunit A